MSEEQGYQEAQAIGGFVKRHPKMVLGGAILIVVAIVSAFVLLL